MSDDRRDLRILGISGSLRPHSFTRRAVEVVLAEATVAGARCELFDLRDYKLPFCPGSSRELESFPDVARLRSAVRESNAVVLGSPEYHGSFSGVLKNALDLTELEDWQGKLIALVGVSGGGMGPVGALAGLRDVGRGLQAWVLPQQVAVANVHKAFKENGEPTDELHDRLAKLGRQTIAAVRRHSF